MFFIFEILPQICKSESEFLLDIWRSRYSFRMTKHPFNNFEGRIIGISGVCSVAEILSDALLMLTVCIQINLSSVVYWVGNISFSLHSQMQCTVLLWCVFVFSSRVCFTPAWLHVCVLVVRFHQWGQDGHVNCKSLSSGAKSTFISRFSTKL